MLFLIRLGSAVLLDSSAYPLGLRLIFTGKNVVESLLSEFSSECLVMGFWLRGNCGNGKRFGFCVSGVWLFGIVQFEELFSIEGNSSHGLSLKIEFFCFCFYFLLGFIGCVFLGFGFHCIFPSWLVLDSACLSFWYLSSVYSVMMGAWVMGNWGEGARFMIWFLGCW